MAATGVRLAGPSGIIAAAALCVGVAGQTRPPEKVVDAVLHRYHGPLRGGFAKAFLQLREDPEAPPTRIFTALPDRVRFDPPVPTDDAKAVRTIDLLVKGAGQRCRKGTEPETLQGADLEALVRLRNHVRGLLLLPLYQADTVTRIRPGVLKLTLPGDEEWQLELDEKDPDLRLIELRGPAGVIRFDSFLDTGATRHPKVVDLAGVGVRHVEILGSKMAFLDTMFEDPLNPKKNGTRDIRERIDRDRPPRPTLRDIPAREMVVMADPGDWKKRVAALRAAGSRMKASKLRPAGLPFYFNEKNATWLAIPFLKGKDAKAYRPAEGESVRREPAHRAVVVGPQEAPWKPAVETGRKAIVGFMAREGLKSGGVLRVMPFVKPTAVPSEKEQGALRLRLELPVAAKAR